MKTSDVRERVSDLKVEIPDTPHHKALLRRKLLAMPKQRRTLASFLLGPTNSSGGFMSRYAKVKVVLVAIVAAAGGSYATYSLQHTPYALAEKTADHSIELTRAMAPVELSALSAQFGGGTPEDALTEAKKAKDLRVISYEEYQAEFANAPGTTTITTGTAGAVSMGSVSITGSAPAGVVTATNAGDAAGAPVPIEQGGVGTGGMIGTAGSSGPVTIIGNGTATTEAPASGTPLLMPAPMNTEDMKAFMPKKYLRYTDPTGHIVVIGLDADDKPMMKAVKMKEGEIPQPIMLSK